MNMNSTNPKYFLGIKTFPIIDGKLSLAEFSSGGLESIMDQLKGSYKPLLEINNLDEVLERINSELNRFKDSTGGPPRFQLYLGNLKQFKILLDNAKLGDRPENLLARELWSNSRDEDFSSSSYKPQPETFPKVKDMKAAMAKIRSYLDDKTEQFVQSDFMDFGQTMIMHVQILNAFARIDLVQQDNSDDVVVIETSYEAKKEEAREEETPLMPNKYEIKVHDLDVYSNYEKVKDAIVILEYKYKKHNLGKVPPLEPPTDNKKISERVKELFRLEKAILDKRITVKELGCFSWYSVKIRSLRKEDIWRRPSEITFMKLPPEIGGRPKDQLNGSGKLSRKKDSLMNLLKTN